VASVSRAELREPRGSSRGPRDEKREAVYASHVLAVFDEAVKRYFEHTTVQFQDFHGPYIATVRLKMVQILKGL